MRSTHTYVLLEVSPPAYQEIRQKLELAGYQHAFDQDGGRSVIDMHGIALAVDQDLSTHVDPAAAAMGTVKSIAVMLGWSNVPPRSSLERNISALKARPVNELRELGQWIEQNFDLGTERSQVADPTILTLTKVYSHILERIAALKGNA